jgi:hypothetical protein
LAALVLAAIFAAIYVPALGHGFVKDDFRWIAAGDVHSPDDLRRIFTTNVGFYRPLVTSSFAIDRAAWGLDPRGYAFTNLLLLAADAALLFLLATRLSLPAPAALFAAAVWAFNFHGINMALLWTSGRTALLLCLFAQASVLALLRGHRLAAGILTLAAMLCKEEAVTLPALLTMVVMFKPQRIGLAAAFVRCWPLWLAAGLYALLREQSGAFGVSDAPAYYHLVVDPRSVLNNVTQYLDRGATVAALATIAVWIAAPHPGPFTRDERDVIAFGALWFASMYAVTVFLPVRSSLYAVAPSIGSALFAAAFAGRAWRAAPSRFARTCTALVAIVAVLVPVYRSRNHGLVEPADLASQSLATIRDAIRRYPAARDIAVIDDSSQLAPVTLDSAFGALFPDAVHLFVGPDVRGTLGTEPPHDAQAPLVFVLRGGRLVQLDLLRAPPSV